MPDDIFSGDKRGLLVFKQGTEVICRSDLTASSGKPGSNPDLVSADLQTLPPLNKNNHQLSERENWNDSGGKALVL